MIIINENVRINKFDECNLQIEVKQEVVNRKTKEKSLQWANYGYYSNLKSALIGVLRKELLETVEEEHTIETLIMRINEIEEDINKAKQ